MKSLQLQMKSLYCCIILFVGHYTKHIYSINADGTQSILTLTNLEKKIKKMRLKFSQESVTVL